MNAFFRALSVTITVTALPLQASAELPAGSQSYLSENFQKLDAIARERRAEGSLPRLSTPEDAKILEALWDREAILGHGPYTSADVPALLDTLDKENAIYKTYMFFSTDPQTLPQTDQNGAFFQDEMSRSLAFALGVYADALEALTDFVTHLKPEEFNDARRQGLQQTRIGIQEFVSGAALMMRSPALRPENRIILATALQENGEKLAASMAVADRQALIAIISTVTAPDAAKSIASFVTAMKSTDCVGLCAIP